MYNLEAEEYIDRYLAGLYDITNKMICYNIKTHLKGK